MHVPLVAAVIGKKVVDDTVEARPVRSVISVSGLGSGDGDVCVLITLYHCVARYLIGTRESDLHKSAMVSPGSEIPALARFVSGEGNHIVPVLEIRSPFLIQGRQETVFVFQPGAKFCQGSGTPVEVDRVAVRR